jgi:hypothetical protein
MGAGTGPLMSAEPPRLPSRQPGLGVPGGVLAAATRAGRRGGRSADLALLRRVRDALVRLPDSAITRHYIRVPGECLASPRAQEP